MAFWAGWAQAACAVPETDRGARTRQFEPTQNPSLRPCPNTSIKVLLVTIAKQLWTDEPLQFSLARAHTHTHMWQGADPRITHQQQGLAVHVQRVGGDGGEEPLQDAQLHALVRDVVAATEQLHCCRLPTLRPPSGLHGAHPQYSIAPTLRTPRILQIIPFSAHHAQWPSGGGLWAAPTAWD